ncbi:autotransporter domain-containing protein [Nitratireductor pacificus]|uniref:Outer membrane autotransporter n=1 Tax=Nitratireductor pacificus pht-3B TaxID=391937 RepID=K2LJ67_9HYPH|nr:autotransporter serine protease [Nitratireductor pacificus]EKF17769.1 outer membrane autotransporter [Nitratireductor pacificus pht-3B]
MHTSIRLRLAAGVFALCVSWDIPAPLADPLQPLPSDFVAGVLDLFGMGDVPGPSDNPLDFLTDEYHSSWFLEHIDAAEAYARGYTGKDIVVGVLDTGLDVTHPEFQGRVSPFSYSFADFSRDVSDRNHHGTHVAGIIGAARNGRGMMGVAYDATIMALKNDKELTTMNALLSYAGMHGVDVVNVSASIGFNAPKPYGSNNVILDTAVVPLQLAPLAYAAMEQAADKDIVMVFSAGNDYQDQPLLAAHPSGHGLLPLVTPENTRKNIYAFLDVDATKDIANPNTYVYVSRADPRVARLDWSDLEGSLISVVATDRNGDLASYSNGCGLAWRWCLAAPGGDAPTSQQTAEDAAILSTEPGGGYKVRRGTSQAAPVVAGGIAVLRQAFPYMTARQVIELALTTTQKSGRQRDFGRGKFDLGRAIQGPQTFGAKGFPMDFDVDTRGYDSLWEGDIGGPGGLVKRGAGNLTLTGNSYYKGDTRVFGGTVSIDGTITSPVAVSHGATLRGTGAVFGTVTLAGTLDPGPSTGNAVGEFFVTKTLLALPNASFVIDVAGGEHDKINVLQNAVILGGVLHVRIQEGTVPAKAPMTIITANSSYGKFDRIETSGLPDSLEPVVTYGKGLVLAFKSKDDGSPGTVEGGDKPAVLQDMVEGGSDGVVQQSSSTASQSVHSAGGEIHADVTSGMIEEGRHLRSATMMRLNAAFDGVGDPETAFMAYGPGGIEPVAASSEKLVFWGDAFGAMGRSTGGADDGVLKHATAGFAMGADAPVSDQWRFGVLAGFSRSTYRDKVRGSRAESWNYHAGAYAGARWGALLLRGGLVASLHDVVTHRRAAPGTGFTAGATARYAGRGLQGFGELGYRFDAQNVSVEPFAGLAHSRLWTDDYREAGDAALSGRASRFETTFASLGVKAAIETVVVDRPARFSAMAGWRSAFGEARPGVPDPAGGPAFSVPGARVTDNALLLGLGADLDFGERASLRLTYNGVVAARMREHSLSARLGVQF